jgi:CBS domain-containing protein
MRKLPLPQSPVTAVRADTSIGQCVRILRDRSIGALVIVSDNAKEEIVGIFTERDLVKNIELIHKGNFWENPVRSVMTTKVKTISPEELDQAPEIMASLNIRHLPIVSKTKGRTHVIGVLSMRDLFRIVMEQYEYKIDKILNPVLPSTQSKRKKRMVGFFTKDDQLQNLLEKAAKMAKRLVVQAGEFSPSLSTQDYVDDFDAVLIDLDPLTIIHAQQAIALAKELSKRIKVMLVFNPATIELKVKEELQIISHQKTIHLLSKPVAFGLLYEQFLKGF